MARDANDILRGEGEQGLRDALDNLLTLPGRPEGQGVTAGMQKPAREPNNRRRRKPHFRGFVSSDDFIGAMKPPDYLVDGLLMRAAAYTLTGNTGHCKTLIALLMAIRVARGEWFCGRRCKPGTVAFFAG